MKLEDYELFLSNAKNEFPKFKLEPKKKSFLMKLISVVLKVITFGKMKNFMENFYTTIGYTIFYPESYERSTFESRHLIITHELVHMRQMARSNLWGVDFIGMVIYSMKYLLLPLPLIRAKYRMEFEVEAYATDIVTAHKLYGVDLNGPRKQSVINLLSGPSYFWTWTDKKDLEEKLNQKINDLNNVL